jgi:hypothetical protein
MVALSQNGCACSQVSALAVRGVSTSRRRFPGWLTAGYPLSASGVPDTIMRERYK